MYGVSSGSKDFSSARPSSIGSAISPTGTGKVSKSKYRMPLIESDLGLVRLTNSSSMPSKGLYLDEIPVIGSCQSLGGSSFRAV